MRKLLSLVTVILFVTACSLSSQAIQTAITVPQVTWTQFPTYTPQPTYTFQPTIVVTRLVVQTPTSLNSSRTADCVPITNMDYSSNGKAETMLRAYVSQLPDVQSLHYTIPEKLYSNSLSELFFIQYTASDGKTYAKRYIVYMSEFGWLNGTFSIDGQCWIDPLH